MSLCSISTCNVAVQFGFSPAILPCLSQNYIMTQFHFKVKKLIIIMMPNVNKSASIVFQFWSANLCTFKINYSFLQMFIECNVTLWHLQFLVLGKEKNRSTLVGN